MDYEEYKRKIRLHKEFQKGNFRLKPPPAPKKEVDLGNQTTIIIRKGDPIDQD